MNFNIIYNEAIKENKRIVIQPVKEMWDWELQRLGCF